MTIIYTQRGFPIEAPLERGVIYESPIVSNIWFQRRGLDKPNFTENQLDLAFLTNEWKLTGGFFKPFLNPNTLTVASVQGYVAETALMLTGRIGRRRVGTNDWTLLLSPVAPKDFRQLLFTPNELEAIKEVASLPVETLITRWIDKIDLADFVDTMQLFVGVRDENAR